MRILPMLIVVAAAWGDGAGAPPRSVVVGTGDPNLDVPAVQAAVDQGGQVLLRGHFSFDRPPTKPTRPEALPPHMATVLVSKEVVIAGTATIDGGTWPFAVETQGFRVAIQGLRFVRPKGGAIQVNGASGLMIADCRIEGIEPVAGLGVGIGIATLPGLPSPSQPGLPENVSGTISIVNNHIDTFGGTTSDKTLGVLIFSVGKSPDREVDLYVSGNRISNVTERAVNIRQAGGRVHIERNVITTGSIVGSAGGAAPDAIHAFGTGSYLIAHNSIQSDWAKGAGIRVHSGFAEWPITGAVVVDNDVTMSAPQSAVFGANSAAIEIRGFAQRNVVLNNRIRGRAGAALAVVPLGPGVPAKNALVMNEIEGFHASLAGVPVEAILDRGVGTVVVNPARRAKSETDTQTGSAAPPLVAEGGKEK